MRVCVLGSGSKGNCTLIEGEKTRLLIDAGRLGARYIGARLGELGLTFGDITAIVATHAHRDHVDLTTYRIMRDHGVRMYVHVGTLPAIMRRTPKLQLFSVPNPLHTFNSAFPIGEFEVIPIEVPHGGGWGVDDVGRPVAFLVRQPDGGAGRTVGFATDLGTVPEDMIERFADADVLAIESNHDVAMELKSSRPDYLINWVIGERGHLSNLQAGNALVRIMKRSSRPPRAILLAHISEDCNTHALALYTAASHLEGAGFGGIPIYACAQREPSPAIEL